MRLIFFTLALLLAPITAHAQSCPQPLASARHVVLVVTDTEKVFIDGELFFDRTLAGYGLTHFAGTPESLPSPPSSGAEPEAEVR